MKGDRLARAFTLLELIIVVIIVGILGALGFSRYNKAVEFQRTAEAKAVLSALRTAEQGYYLQNGAYTSSFEAIGVSAATACESNYYFEYDFEVGPPRVRAHRCTDGGKTPDNHCAYWNILRLDGTYYSQDCSGVNYEGSWLAW